MSLDAVAALIALIAPVVSLRLYAFLIVFWYPGGGSGAADDESDED